jgi:hypothetical protein
MPLADVEAEKEHGEDVAKKIEETTKDSEIILEAALRDFGVGAGAIKAIEIDVAVKGGDKGTPPLSEGFESTAG